MNVTEMKDIGNAPELALGMYKHYKGGMYEVVNIACHTETLEWYVVYESQERKQLNMPSVWVRPYGMFLETVEVDGIVIQRFEKIDG